MDNTPVNVYYNYYQKDADDLVGFEEKDISYEKAKKIFDAYPWSDELIALEQRGEGGGMNYYKGDYNNVYANFIVYAVEDDKFSIIAEVRAKKGFLGLFGNKEVNKDFSDLSSNDAKAVIKDIFSYNENELFDMYK